MLALARRRALAERITLEDTDAIGTYNAHASQNYRLRTELGALPHDGNIERAPVVLLLGSPAFDETASMADHQSRPRGWPLAGLHPEAPSGLSAVWQARLSSLIDAFGAQHVANSVAALPLTPWASHDFDDRLRLPSRARMLEMAGVAARRGALLIVTCFEELWTESPEVADLSCERRFHPRSWRATHVSVDNLGAASWHAVCRRIEAHPTGRLAL